MEPPLKRRRLSSDSLADKKARNDRRLKSRFEAIFEKYSHDFTGIGDEIDIKTGEIVVNNGHLRCMKNEIDIEGRPNRVEAQLGRDLISKEDQDELDGSCQSIPAPNGLSELIDDRRSPSLSSKRQRATGLAPRRALRTASEELWQAPPLPQDLKEVQGVFDYEISSSESERESIREDSSSLWSTHQVPQSRTFTKRRRKGWGWSIQEDEQLEHLKFDKQMSLKEIAKRMPHRTHAAVHQRWYSKHRGNSRSRGPKQIFQDSESLKALPNACRSRSETPDPLSSPQTGVIEPQRRAITGDQAFYDFDTTTFETVMPKNTTTADVHQGLLARAGKDSNEDETSEAGFVKGSYKANRKLRHVELAKIPPTQLFHKARAEPWPSPPIGTLGGRQSTEQNQMLSRPEVVQKKECPDSGELLSDEDQLERSSISFEKVPPENPPTERLEKVRTEPVPNSSSAQSGSLVLQDETRVHGQMANDLAVTPINRSASAYGSLSTKHPSHVLLQNEPICSSSTLEPESKPTMSLNALSDTAQRKVAPKRKSSPSKLANRKSLATLSGRIVNSRTQGPQSLEAIDVQGSVPWLKEDKKRKSLDFGVLIELQEAEEDDEEDILTHGRHQQPRPVDRTPVNKQLPRSLPANTIMAKSNGRFSEELEDDSEDELATPLKAHL